MIQTGLALMLLGTMVAIFRYHRSPDPDPARHRKRGHFLVGFTVGQGLIWSFLLGQRGVGAPFRQEFQFIVSLFLFFFFIALIVSIMDR